MSRRTHGESGPVERGSAEYRIWIGIKTRCLNRRARTFLRYGGRGIGISLVWVNDFPRFLADVGRRPTPAHSIDRIDWNKGYLPGNVRWATKSEQALNRQDRHQLTIDGVTKYLSEWAAHTGVDVRVIWNRLYVRNWLPAAAVFTSTYQTHCQNGHLLSETARWEGNARRCRTCKKAYDAKYRKAAA